MLEEEDDVEELKLYVFDWSVPPEINEHRYVNNINNTTVMTIKYDNKEMTYCLFSADNWTQQQCCVMICFHRLKKDHFFI